MLHISVEKNGVSSGLVERKELAPGRRRARIRLRVNSRAQSSAGSSRNSERYWRGRVAEAIAEFVFPKRFSQPLLEYSPTEDGLG